MDRYSQRGQTLLVIVLVMVVALTVSLSIAARMVTTLRVSSEEANSEKAFQAAESGVDYVLKSGQQITTAQDLGNHAVIASATYSDLRNISQYIIRNGVIVAQDDGIDVWLSDYSPQKSLIYNNPWSGGLTVYWSLPSDNCGATPPQAAALSLILISGSKTAPTIHRYAVDPCSRLNGFSPAGAGTTIGTVVFKNSYHIGGITNGLLLRIIPLYSGTILGIKLDAGSANFPSQGKIITSRGSSGTTTRQISYFQGYDSVPSEFFYSLFSQ